MNKNIFRLGFFIALLVCGALPALANTYTVDVLTDEADDTECVVDTSFRDAIGCALANPGADVIDFSGSGTLTFTSWAPAISDTGGLVVDGGGDIVLSGNSQAVEPINLTGQNIQIKGFTFKNFKDTELVVQGDNNTVGGSIVADRNVFVRDAGASSGNSILVNGNGNTIQNNYVGMQADGDTSANRQIGISVQGASDTTIEDNVITAANYCSITWGGSLGNITVVGNNIGLNAAGDTGFDSGSGICDTAAVGGPSETYNGLITIGGDTGVDATARNIISGSGVGILLRGDYAGGMRIQGNYIGTDVNGTSSVPGWNGIAFSNLSCSGGGGCYIGGNTAGKGNVISGNSNNGIQFAGDTSGLTVLGNFIGVNKNGDTALANGGSGVWITGSATNNFIGHVSYPNVISGNNSQGVHVQDNTGTNYFPGNYVGTDSTGMVAVPNIGSGFWIQQTGTAVIGNVNAVSPTSVISGNGDRAIRGGSGDINVYSSIIGLKADQTGSLPNGMGIQGVDIIGNTRTAGYNVISGNTGVGINGPYIVKGNFIGVNSSETASFPNGGGGIYSEWAMGVTIGGENEGEGNVIGGHASPFYQIDLSENVSDVNIWGNYIGMFTNGSLITGTGKGIHIQGDNFALGGNTAYHRNYIGGTAETAIDITGSVQGSIEGNYIGVKPDGTAAAIGDSAIVIDGLASDITIGGNSPDVRNVISSATNYGIEIDQASDITIMGNYIGTDPTGMIARGSTRGISVPYGSNIYIGRNDVDTEHAANVISGNSETGVMVSSSNSDTIFIEGNIIGLNAAMDAKLGNNDGVSIQSGATNVIVGGEDSASKNTISGNNQYGLFLLNMNSVEVKGNYIGTNSNNDPGFGNGSHGLIIWGDSDNNIIGFPFSTTTLDSSKRNIINHNGGYGLVLGQGVSDNNTIRGNILGPNNDTGDMYFDSNPNNEISLSGTSLTTVTTSKVAGTTNFANGTKVDIYNIDDSLLGTNVVYEGTAVVSGGAFELNMDFDAVAGDSYFIQIIEAGGDSTDFMGDVVVADTTKPAMPGGINSEIVTESTYTFNGTKDAWTKIKLTLPGPTAQDIVGFDGETTWSYEVVLDPGANNFGFSAEDYSGNTSYQNDVTVTYDSTAPTTPVITSATSATGTESTSAFTITGTKEANTSVYLNGELIVALGEETVWSYNTTLSVGVNVVGPFMSKDQALNESGTVNAVITYAQDTGDEEEEETQAVYYGGGGGGGGGSGSSGNSAVYDFGNSVEEEVVQVEEEVVEVVPEEDLVEENAADEYPVYVPDTESVEEEIIQVEEETISAPQEEVKGNSVIKNVVEVIEGAATTVAETAENLFSSAPEEDPGPAFAALDAKLPETAKGSRQDVLLEGAYVAITDDSDGDKIPDSLEEIYFGSDDVLDVNADTDGDGLTDGEELMLGTDLRTSDSDGDGLSDAEELAAGTDANSLDSDHDGLTDKEEAELGTNPVSNDSDGDGYSDYVERYYGGGGTGSELDPNVGVKDDDGDGAADEWEKEFGMEDINYDLAQYVEEVDAMLKIPFKMRDTDGDGVPDWEEMNRGTNPNSPDTDRDGLSDSDEIYVYFTDPLKDSRDQAQIYKPRLSNVRDGAKFTGNRATLVGVGMPNSRLTVFFLPREWVAAKPGLLSVGHMLYTSLFDDGLAEGIYSEDVYTDASGKFLLQKDLPTGRFDVMVRSYNLDGTLADETLPYEIEVSEDLADGSVVPYRLDKENIDLEDVKIIVVENSRPLLYGKATRGYTLEGMWASELFTSSLVVDTESAQGEFVMMAPNSLEDGLHEVVVHGVDPLSSLYTAAVNVDFRVTGGIMEVAEKDTNARMKIIGVGLGIVLIVFIFGLLARVHKRTPQN